MKLSDYKAEIYQRFQVESVQALKENPEFLVLTEDRPLDWRRLESWQWVYQQVFGKSVPVDLDTLKKQCKVLSGKNLTQLKKEYRLSAKEAKTVEGWKQVLETLQTRQRGMINGVNVLTEFFPWQVFGVDGRTASTRDLKTAFRRLSKVYHPDVPATGDREVFEKVHRLYEHALTTVGG